MLLRRSAVAPAVFLSLLLTACTSSSTSNAPAASTAVSTAGTTTSGAPAPASSPSAPSHQLYVSVGDSYAAGYQPTGPKSGSTTRNGFAYQVVGAAKAKGYDFTLANFGCGGATTTSILHSRGCPARFLGPGATPYSPKTQAAAAEDYLRAHRGHVGLVSVSIGGNDIVPCGAAANPVPCLTTALAKLKANLATLLTGLRAAAGPTAQIVGTTYPDVFLGGVVSADPAAKQLASLSVTAFQSLVNPALKSSYTAVHGSFVDVTAATGAYGSLTATTTLAPYGKIPVPVAKICQLTYFCQFHDIHPRTNGYALIARLVVGTLPHR